MAHSLNSLPCVDPAALARACAEADPPIPTDRWLGKAGSFAVPVGRECGRGWVLLRKSALDQLTLTSDLTLTFSGADAAHVRTLQKITLLHAECADPGSALDPDAAFVCELVDRRYHLARIPIDRAYNLVAADGTDYLAGTLNGGTPWTWQEVVTDLATALGIGALTLLFTPDGTPESFAFWAPANAWDALCDVLDRLACAVEYDPEADAFAVVRLGAADATSSAAQAALAGSRLWDGYTSENARGWRPEKARVVFQRLPQPTGGTSPVYAVDVTLAAAPGVVPGTVVDLLDDTVARGATGTPSNSAALATRAAERAADWLRKRSGYERRLLRVYRDFQSGARLAGSTVGRATYDDRGGPFATTIQSHPDGRLEMWRPSPGTMQPWGQSWGGAALTVEEVDGSPSVADVTTIRFDQADAFVVTEVSPGTARIDLNMPTLATALAPSLLSVLIGAPTYDDFGLTIVEAAPGVFVLGVDLVDVGTEQYTVYNPTSDWVLSCGVFTRTVERRLVSHLLNAAGMPIAIDVGAPVETTETLDICLAVQCCQADALALDVAADETGVVGAPVAVLVTGSGGVLSYTYTVDWGDGSDPEPFVDVTGAGHEFEHEYEAPGDYEITVTVTDACGCSYDADTADVAVACAATPLAVTLDITPCAACPNQGANGPIGGLITFGIGATGGTGSYSYAIDYDDGTSGSHGPDPDGDHTFTHSYGAPGLYEVVITVTSGTCVWTKTVPVVISEDCPTCVAVCPGGYPGVFTWNLSGGTGSYAGANGAWKIFHGDDTTDPDRCWFYWINDNGWVAAFYMQSAGVLAGTITSPDGVTSISMGGENTVAGCCGPYDATILGVGGTGTVPVIDGDTIDGGDAESCIECDLDPIDSACCPGNPIPGRIYLKVKDPGTLATVATVALNNPDDTFWRGSGVLPCGQVIYFRYAHPDILGCALEWSCNNVNWTPVSAIVDCDQSCSPFCIPGIQFTLTGTGCVACSGTAYRATLSGSNDDACACPGGGPIGGD